MAKYRDAVQWIADNDEPTLYDPKAIATQITTQLVSDIFKKNLMQVAMDIYKARNDDFMVCNNDIKEPL